MRKPAPIFFLFVGITSCAPMTSVRLTPHTSIGDVRAGAKKGNDGMWEICLSLPNPSGAVQWSVNLTESYNVVRHDQPGRSNFSWVIPIDRWHKHEPFQAQVIANGINEIIRIPHPTRDNTISDGASLALDILFLPTKVPRI